MMFDDLFSPRLSGIICPPNPLFGKLFGSDGDVEEFKKKADSLKDSNRFIDEDYLSFFAKGLDVESVTITHLTNKEVEIMCSNSIKLTLTTTKGVSPDLYIGECINAKK